MSLRQHMLQNVTKMSEPVSFKPQASRSGFAMFASSKFLLGTTALLAASVVAAAPVSLGDAGAYNLVSFGDFNSRNTSIGGSVAVAGDLTASSYSLNGSSLVVGGNLTFNNGSIGGNAYVGGSTTTSQMNIKGQWQSGTAPLAFTALAQEMGMLSTGLASVAATGNYGSQWGGVQMTGSNSAVEVFNFSGADLQAANWSNASQLAAGSTLIFNISGTNVSLGGGLFNGLNSYNVLLNFYEAESLSFNNIGLQASVLAPNATVSGGSGRINGNVVVGDWQSSITLQSGNGFRAADVAGFVLPEPMQPDRPVLGMPPADMPAGAPVGAVPGTDAPVADAPASEVPEPGQLALFCAGLAALVFVARRRKTAAKA
jgi:choice-of-anchor A domain-containing protein